jgi:hypothetical protein
MSTSPEALRADDEIVALLSEWLAVQVSNDELRRRLLLVDTDSLGAEQVDLVDELLAELGRPGVVHRGDLEMLVRETLETVALGN